MGWKLPKHKDKEEYKGEISCLNKEIANQEAYSRSRENQLFEGIKEAPLREGNFEDTASVLLLFLSLTLKIYCHKEIEFQRFHHLGGKKVQKSLQSKLLASFIMVIHKVKHNLDNLFKTRIPHFWRSRKINSALHYFKK